MFLAGCCRMGLGLDKTYLSSSSSIDDPEAKQGAGVLEAKNVGFVVEGAPGLEGAPGTRLKDYGCAVCGTGSVNDEKG